MMNLDGPIMSGLSFRSKVVQLSRGLSSVDSYVDAARELLCCSRFSPQEFQDHCTKVLELVEISRDTLLRLDIRLHSFCSCPPSYQPLKEVYYELLRMLKSRCKLFPPGLRERVARLTLPLVTTFRICDGLHDHEQCMLDEFQLQSRHFTLAENGTYCSDKDLMPPPDKISRSQDNTFTCQWTPRKPRGPPMVFPLYVTEELDRSDEEGMKDDSEETAFRPVLLKPMTRHFGIFCSKNSSMFRLH
ncbi:uncharacterized protein EV420DRAFT_542801 [Desarmillaria tabescens]|uniref:Uncharacterized protein n=1 Tax=Armillaria tabescens TaxID=1929756 RepID=A0AA39K9P5_ARMTA|nr:uncharacterized protein EV420DRAFT_542801 [Desarmillaria tabescens]KAK0457154.1 hypothetical protein EV420DRAFT_542801 [Desarmillaria tabescens]